jgi:small-conductance mechanosensitive channel
MQKKRPEGRHGALLVACLLAALRASAEERPGATEPPSVSEAAAEVAAAEDAGAEFAPPIEPPAEPSTMPDDAGATGGVDAGPADAGAPAETPGAGVTARAAEVRVGDTVVFTLSVARGTQSPAMRARIASDALEEAVTSAKPEDVRVEHTGTVSVVYIGAAPVVQLTREDAQAAGDASLTVHADRIAAAIRQALKAEQQRTAVANTIFNVSLAVLFAVLAVYLLRRAWDLGDRAEQWLEMNPERVPALKLRTVEVLNRGTVRGALSLLVGAGRWLVLLGLVYAWLIATLSLFESTRGLTEKLSGALVEPLAALASRVAASVPLIVILFFAGLTLALVLRAVRLFFDEVAQGTTTVAWLPKDLAAPTGVLTQLGLVALALVLVSPVITGDPDGAFTRIGLVLLVALGLASVPVLATMLLGAVALFGRRLKTGDWVEIGPRMGRVIDVGLLETTLRDNAGVELKVPHLSWLWNPTRVHGPTPRVTASLTVDRALATAALATRLERVLSSLGTSPVVRLLDVEATHVTLELTVSSTAADARSAMLWLALGEVEAAKQETP